MSYKLLQVWEADCGGSAKIALCAAFNQIADAENDGCHMALVHNKQTKAWAAALDACIADWMKYPAYNRQLPRRDDKPYTVMASIESEMGEHFRQVVGGFDFESGISVMTHVDRLSKGAKRGLFTSKPTTLIRTKRPVHLGGMETGFETASGIVAIERETNRSCTLSPVFSPVPGSLILFFQAATHPDERLGITLAHTSPDMPPDKQAMRASVYINATVS